MYTITTADGYVLYYPGAETSSVYNAVLTETLNDAGQLVFTMPKSNNAYDIIEEGVTKIYLYNDNEIKWRGYVESTSVNFRQDKTVTCIGELSYLTRSAQYQTRFMDKRATWLLNWYLREHNRMSDEQFERGTVTLDDDTTRSNIYTNYESTLEAIRTNICDNYGVYIKLRHEGDTRYVDLYDINNYGELSNQIIQFGENLLDYSKNISTLDIYTQVLPLGAKLDTQYIVNLDNRLNIESVNDGVQYLENETLKAKFGARMKVVKWDDVTIAANLKTKAEAWLNTQQFETMQLNLNALDLSALNGSIDAFDLGDRVRVVAPVYDLDITLPVMSKTTNLQAPDKNEITLGNSVQLTYTQLQIIENAQSDKSINEALSGSLSVGENITLNGGDAANLIRFKSANHDSYIYGGNDGSGISIGAWDATGTGNAIWRYNDTQKKLALYCNGINYLGDMVTESGTTNGWEYVKYASGLYTCTKKASVTLAVNTATGSLYYGDITAANAITFPITFAAAPAVTATINSTSTTGAFCSVQYLTTASTRLRLFRATSSGSATYTVSISVVGRWQ